MIAGPQTYRAHTSGAAELRIGIYSSQYPGLPGVNLSGGIGTYTRSLANALTRLGHSVHVLSQSDQPGRYEIGGVNVHCIQPMHFPIVERWIPCARNMWRAGAAARKLSKDYALDVFEFPNWEGYSRCYKWSRLRLPPLVVRCHTSCAEIVEIESTAMTRAVRFACGLERAACKTADALYVSTYAHMNHMAHELGISEEAFTVLPLGIPDVASRMAGIAKHPREIRKPCTALYLGRLEKRKGTVDLLNAVPQIVRHVPDFRLVLIGQDRAHAPGGKMHSEYFATEFPPALQKHVIFAGSLSNEDVEQWFADSALLVAPSIYESFGLIFIEAMRWSLPVVGTHAGGIPEVVEHGVNGLLTEVNSPEQIARSIVTLLTNEDLRMRLATAARETYERKFTDMLMAARTVDFYRSVIEQREYRTAPSKRTYPIQASKSAKVALSPKS